MQQALRPVAGRPAAFRQRQPATLLVRSSLGSGAGASTSTSPKGSTLLYDKLQGIKVIRSSDGAKVDLTTLWELAIQLRRDVKPKLDERGIRLFLVSIGTWERSKEFVKVTGFPADSLLVDPENQTYDALGLAKGVAQTFFSWETPLAIKKRMDEKRTGDLEDVMSRWQPWIPPKQDQAFQQGGIFVFDGPRCTYSHYDKATGAHADLGQVLGIASLDVPLVQGEGEACGTAACDLPPPPPPRA